MAGTTTLDISEARKQFNTIDERLATDPIIYVTRHNKTAFAIVNVEHICAMLETLEIMSDPDSFQMFQKSLEDIRKGRLHDHEDVKNELG
jgi:PHD/YefM family antitoxin component YafN of YafNO toxin-antitoxin module